MIRSDEIEDDIDPNIDIIPIPMDAGTRTKLVRFAAAIGKQPIHAAAELLRDLLDDAEFWEAAEVSPETLN